MGYDAFIHICKKKYTKKTIEDLILMLGYEKRKYGFYCGYDKDYKYDAGVQVFKEEEVPDNDEVVYRVRVQIFGNGYDLKKANETISAFKKYCNVWFVSDNDKNRYFDTEELIGGAENGCYLSISRLYNNFVDLEHSLKKYPEDSETERQMQEWGMPSPSLFNANVYLS